MKVKVSIFNKPFGTPVDPDVYMMMAMSSFFGGTSSVKNN